jgi:hypothetical protein
MGKDIEESDQNFSCIPSHYDGAKYIAKYLKSK